MFFFLLLVEVGDGGTHGAHAGCSLVLYNHSSNIKELGSSVFFLFVEVYLLM